MLVEGRRRSQYAVREGIARTQWRIRDANPDGPQRTFGCVSAGGEPDALTAVVRFWEGLCPIEYG